RFELYGWVAPDNGVKAADRPVDQVVAAVAGESADVSQLNVLRGREALHHLLRTAAGLNSGLPGDGEVVGQMEVAHELASRCEAAGPRTERLRDEVRRCLDHLCDKTAWGGFRPEYCTVSLKRVALDLDVDWPRARCVIIGGSVTALSTVVALKEHFGVPPRHLTVAYRNHKRGKLMKRIRAAAEGGTRLRLDTYADPRLQRAIAEADVIVFALDSRTPVVDRSRLEAARDLAARPMTIIDFNTFGSTDGAAGIDGVRLVDAARLDEAVAEFSEGLLDCAVFATATQQAESGIRQHVCRITNGCPGCVPVDPTASPAPARVPQFCPSCPRRHALATCPQRLMTERIAS
ncbi:MAG: glutamyl-tRNA reductase, partial [Planctomycetota bacterium]